MVRLTNETDCNGPKSRDLVLREFPLTLGRGSRAGFRLEQAGVWEEHTKLLFAAGRGFFARPCGEALLVVNGQAVSEDIRLRNGDLLELGSARLRFGFTETRQRRFRFRERSTWVAIGLLCIAQLILVYAVLP